MIAAAAAAASVSDMLTWNQRSVASQHALRNASLRGEVGGFPKEVEEDDISYSYKFGRDFVVDSFAMAFLTPVIVLASARNGTVFSTRAHLSHHITVESRSYIKLFFERGIPDMMTPSCK